MVTGTRHSADISGAKKYMAGGRRFTCDYRYLTSPDGTDRHRGLELAGGVHILTRKFQRFPGTGTRLRTLVNGSITFNDTLPLETADRQSGSGIK